MNANLNFESLFKLGDDIQKEEHAIKKAHTMFAKLHGELERQQFTIHEVELLLRELLKAFGDRTKIDGDEVFVKVEGK